VATPEPQPDRWKRVEAIFQTAVEMAPNLRPEYLTTACGADEELRREVAALLESAGNTLGFLVKPIQDAADAVSGPQAMVGRRIGPYEILRPLGEGGMGSVFLAARADEQYHHQVAIKLMHAALGSSESMQARFRAERQILANLDHPNIARLLDGGVLSLDGPGGFASSPYLVMEYVDGVAIDEYCRDHRLSIDDRLRLFLVVCGAVSYAHNNLVVHRDIKPANILVSAGGIPKLLDFGIAKLLDPEFGDDSTGRTRASERLMTLEYASPEQIRGEPVTTSTDVHALGVLLYELLTAQHPFPVATKSSLEAALVICEREPRLPSTVVAGTPETAGEARKMKGDLDNIVLMAMRKEPARRYASVAHLAADVRAYLDGYPLVARTDSWGYRSRKFVRRHRFGVAASIAMVLALVAFAIAMGVLARRAKREQEIAQRQAQFLSDMFQAATPEQARGTVVSARDLLDRGAQRVDREFAAEPEVRAFLLESMAGAYKSLGVLDQAEKLAQRSYDLKSRLAGPANTANAGVLDLLATVIRLEGQYQRAEPLFRRVLTVRRKALGEDNVDVASAYANLGECLYLENKDAEAETNLRAALAIERRLGADLGAGTRNYLALELERRGAYPEAKTLLREAAEIDKRTQGADSPDYARTLHNLASSYIDSGDLQSAEPQLREALAIRRKVLGNDHPDLFYGLNNLSVVLLTKGDWEGAEQFAREGLALEERVLPAGHPQIASAHNGLARVLEAENKLSEAEQEYRQALDILHAANQSTGWAASQINLNLAILQLDRRQYAEAERRSRWSLDTVRKLGGDEAPLVANALIEVAEDRVFQGDAQSAEPLLRQALKIRQEKYRPGHPLIIFAQTRLGEALTGEGKYAEAEPILRQAVSSAHNAEFPLAVWQVAEPESALAACLAGLRHTSEAQQLIAASQSGLQKDPRQVFRTQACARLAEVRRLSTK
jgi:eukaryotic-like serine/threonine-protein kinase